MEGKLGRAIMRLMPSAAEVLRVELQASPHVHPKHVHAHVAKLVLQLDLPNMVKEILIRNIKIVQVKRKNVGDMTHNHIKRAKAMKWNSPYQVCQ